MGERVAIVGSRDYPWAERVRLYVAGLPDGTEVISGGARGVDRIAETAAIARGLKVLSLKAKWDKHGKAAGFLRNTDIVACCDRVVAFWDGQSRGTLDTITKAREARKPVEVIGV